MFHANFNFCPFNYKFLIVLVFCSSVTSVTELARGLACLLLELRREVVRSGEVELIGNVLDAAVGSSEQVLGTLQLKVHLIVCRREVGVFLEYAVYLLLAMLLQSLLFSRLSIFGVKGFILPAAAVRFCRENVSHRTVRCLERSVHRSIL